MTTFCSDRGYRQIGFDFSKEIGGGGSLERTILWRQFPV
jgi:hypothetical protein